MSDYDLFRGAKDERELDQLAGEARIAATGGDDAIKQGIEAAFYKRRSEIWEARAKPKREAFERDEAAKRRQEQYPLASVLNVDLGLGLGDDESRWSHAEAKLSEYTDAVRQATLDADPEFQSKLASEMAYRAYGPASGTQGVPISMYRGDGEKQDRVQQTNRRIHSGEKLGKREAQTFIADVGNSAVSSLLRANRRGQGR